jgi:proteasome lid subunit RPN8/RPN11
MSGNAPLAFPAAALAEMVAAAYAAYPLEACGLLVGTGSEVRRFVACTNESSSAKVYSIPPRAVAPSGPRTTAGDHRVFHSHTHTEPYPSPTDVAQAVDPAWHYVIVSLKRDSPESRCYLIEAEGIREVPITVA